MKASEALALSDKVLASLYSEWSEDNYCASWEAGEYMAQRFAEDLLTERVYGGQRVFEPYELETLAAVRAWLAQQVKP